MNSLGQRFSGHSAKQRQHPHVSRGDRRRARHKHDEQHNQNPQLQDSFPCAAQVYGRQTSATEFKSCWIGHFFLRLAPRRTATKPHHLLHSLLRKNAPPDFRARSAAPCCIAREEYLPSARKPRGAKPRFAQQQPYHNILWCFPLDTQNCSGQNARHQVRCSRAVPRFWPRAADPRAKRSPSGDRGEQQGRQRRLR